MSKKPPQLFFLLAGVNLSAEMLNLPWGVYLTKPLLLTTLSCWFYLSVAGRFDPFSRWMLAGFIFSIGGDTLLMFVELAGEAFFLMGLVCFLLTHLCYITAFQKYPCWKEGRVAKYPWSALPLVFYLGIFSWFLWNDLPSAFKIPVLVYSAAITVMAAAALNMGGRTTAGIAGLLFAGALLFVLSDSLIALHKFKADFRDLPQVRVLIMVTYLAGQYLLVKGSILAHALNRPAGR